MVVWVLFFGVVGMGFGLVVMGKLVMVIVGMGIIEFILSCGFVV